MFNMLLFFRNNWFNILFNKSYQAHDLHQKQNNSNLCHTFAATNGLILVLEALFDQKVSKVIVAN